MANVTVKIDVTEIDIKTGLPRSSCNCPIAQACERTFAHSVSVTRNYVRVAGEKKFDLPWEATKFIHAFDYGKPVQPFSFELTDVPEELLKK